MLVIPTQGHSRFQSRKAVPLVMSTSLDVNSSSQRHTYGRNTIPSGKVGRGRSIMNMIMTMVPRKLRPLASPSPLLVDSCGPVRFRGIFRDLFHDGQEQYCSSPEHGNGVKNQVAHLRSCETANIPIHFCNLLPEI